MAQLATIYVRIKRQTHCPSCDSLLTLFTHRENRHHLNKLRLYICWNCQTGFQAKQKKLWEIPLIVPRGGQDA